MKLATFQTAKGGHAIGTVNTQAGVIKDITLAFPDRPEFASMQALIEAGPEALDELRRFEARSGGPELDLADVRLLAPVPRPIQMRDAMSFPLHIRQSLRGLKALEATDEAERRAILAAALPDLPEVYRANPAWYFTNHLCVSGPGTAIRWPRYSKVMDFELELGMFTWQTAANIPEARAGDHIFGFTIFNDFSARDQQSIDMPAMLGPAKGKSFDQANVIGPWIVTPDELGSPYDLKTRAVVNDTPWAEGDTSGMLFSFEELIANLSRDETLHAGEFIASGTVENGCGLEMNRFLQPGDQLRLEIEKIGSLDCAISAE